MEAYVAVTKQLLIQFSDGAEPEVFSHNCTINSSRDFAIEATTTDASAPDCEAPDAPNWVLRAVDTLSAGINGAGTMDPVSFGVLRDYMLAGAPFAVRVTLGGAGADLGGHFSGNYVMTSLGVAKEGKGYVSATVALQSDGEIVWVPGV
ncbi:phage tail tube protein [Mesorhizobium sp. CAU 1732]|uniref:phage tail tube protein n=1 Tax=Mesorhizobium sp. CAU 1732 TaxID=3140358 RepID=UPI003260DEE8